LRKLSNNEKDQRYCSIEWFKIIVEIDFRVVCFPEAFACPELETGRMIY
jgi:hypothetical protein